MSCQENRELLKSYREDSKSDTGETKGIPQPPLFKGGTGEVTVLPKEFGDCIKKIDFTEAVMYRTVSNDFKADESFDYDMLVFFSPAGISSLLKNFPNFNQKDIRIGCFGPTTAKAVKDAGLRLDVEAPTPEAPSMTAALEQYLKKESGNN